MIALLIVIVVSGFVIGALGRLLVPGPNPMGFVRTTLVGIAGSFLGGLVGRIVFGWRYLESGLLAVVVAVAATALLVTLIDRPRRIRTP